MAHRIVPGVASAAWKLARRQHGVVTRAQLLELGLTKEAVKHRIVKGRLHPVASGVYAVGRPSLTRYGRWMAAVLSCGSSAVLSHQSAAAIWEIRRHSDGPIHVSIPRSVARQRPGVVVHRRDVMCAELIASCHGIPVTSPVCTLIDLATCLDSARTERAIDQADSLGLVTPDQLREALHRTRQPGVRAVRTILDRRTFVLTDSELERLFLPLAREVGLPKPQTRIHVNGFRVDFFWPELGLVVETDGLRYHRTPAQQTRDRRRDQAHTAAGLTPLRFTHAQIRYEPAHVLDVLAAVARR